MEGRIPLNPSATTFMEVPTLPRRPPGAMRLSKHASWFLWVLLLLIACSLFTVLNFQAREDEREWRLVDFKGPPSIVYDQCIGWFDSDPSLLGYDIRNLSSHCQASVMRQHCLKVSGKVNPLEASTSAAYIDDELPFTSVFGTSDYRQTLPAIRLAYIIFTHGGAPEQLTRLIERIYDPNDFFAIHVDAKSAGSYHSYVAALVERVGQGARNILILPSMNVLWGGAGMMEATFEGMRRLLELGEWDFYVNLSESDYPIAPLHEIKQVLYYRRGYNFVNWDDNQYANKGYSELVECDNHMYYIFDAPNPQNVVLARGAQWFILSRQFCKWASTSMLVTMLKELIGRTPMPDERIMQSALASSPFNHTVALENYRVHLPRLGELRCVEERAKTFVGFTWCGYGPRDLTVPDYEAITEPSVFWTRKFKPGVSDELLSVIDARLEKSNPTWEPVPAHRLESNLAFFTRLGELAVKQALPNSGATLKNVLNIRLLTVEYLTHLPTENAYDVFRMELQTNQGTTVTARVDLHMKGFCSGRLLRNDIGMEHDRSRFAFQGRQWVLNPSEDIIMQQTWHRGIANHAARLQVLSYPNLSVVHSVELNIDARWRFAWSVVPAIQQEGQYLVQILREPDGAVVHESRLHLAQDPLDKGVLPDDVLLENVKITTLESGGESR